MDNSCSYDITCVGGAGLKAEQEGLLPEGRQLGAGNI